MTIAYFSNGYRGGASTFLEQNINYNLKNNKKVILIDKNPKKTFPNLKLKKNLQIIKLDIFKERKKIKNFFKKDTSKNYFFFFTNFAILIYYFFFFFSFKKKKIKVAMALHSGVFKYNAKTIIGLILFSIFSLKLDYLIFGSYSSKKWWLGFFPWMCLINHKVILNGIEKAKITKTKKLYSNISFIGRLEKENDPYLFLDVSNLNKNNKNFRFNIFGDGTLKEDLKKNSKNIKFWGWEKREKIYKNTDITLITSPLNNFPYTALESNSYGIPVITASKGDIRMIIKNNFGGYLFNGRTKENYNKYLKKAVKNYKRLSKNSLINAKKFELGKSCYKIWRFLNIENTNTR